MLHTGEVHCATFEAIFHALEPSVEITHTVREDLLDRARTDGPMAVRAETVDALREIGEADAVLCTCSTLGPWAEEAAKDDARIVRIDRPLMEAACGDGSEILVAICLESTRQATLDLLGQVALDMGRDISPEILLCDGAWVHFEAGDVQAYARQIASDVKDRLNGRAKTDCVVLAQASMRPAEALLTDIGVPVRSSPILAATRALEIARARR